MRARLHTNLIAALSLAGLVAGGLTGCVSQKEYDLLQQTNRSLESQIADLNGRLDGTGQRLGSLQQQRNAAGNTIEGLQAENASLRQQLSQTLDTLDGFEARLASLNFVQLDPATDQALSRLARENAGLITYDSQRGMLRFSSDLTFNSGSDIVKQEVVASLQALANVLNSADASGYDLRIEGHTDSEAISANTAQRHPTNMHLAAHRAIAVRRTLGNEGLGWDRMSVSGWGEHRPVIQNNPTGGTAANRRVEIFVVPTSRNASIGSSEVRANVNPDREAAPARIDPTK